MRRNKIFTNIIVFFMIVNMIVLSFPDQMLMAEELENASEYQIIKIYNVGDLLQLAENCHEDSYSVNKQIMLMSDIVLGDEQKDFTIPVFNGIFEGNGYTISNFKSSTDGYVVGFFRYIKSKGIVRNLNLEGNVSAGDEKESIGGLCGKNNGFIYNCTFTGTVDGKNQTGGIAAINETTGTIRLCTAKGRITGYYYTGGVCGKNYGIIDNCINKANVNDSGEWVAEDDEIGVEILSNISEQRDTVKVTSGVDTGGIAGLSEGIIIRCRNRGLIGYEHTGYNIGGIVGRQSGLVSSCTNEGTIYGRKDVGGIVGQLEPYIQLDESESLKNEVNKLHDMMEKTLTDMENASNAIDQNVKNIQHYSDNSINASKAITDHFREYINENTDVINDTADRLDTVIEMLPAVMNPMESVTDHAKNLNHAIRKISEDLNLEGKLSDNMYQETDYRRVTITDGVGGEIICSNMNPDEGSEITFKVEPENGYSLNTMVVTDADGKEVVTTKTADHTYQIVMPSKNIVVRADFLYTGSNGTNTDPVHLVVTSNAGGEATVTGDDATRKVTVKITPDLGYTLNSAPLVTDKNGNEISINRLYAGSYDYEFILAAEQEPACLGITFERQSQKQAVDDALDRIDANIVILNEQSTKIAETIKNIQGELVDSNGNYKTLAQLRADDTLKGYINDLLDELSIASNAASFIMRDLSLVANIYGPYISDSANKANNDVNEATQIVSKIIDCLNHAEHNTRAIVNYLNAQSDLQMSKISQEMSNSMDHFRNQLQGISNSIGKFSDDASAYSALVNQDFKAINDQINVILNLLIDKMNELTSGKQENQFYRDVSDEISEEEIEEATTGKVLGCTNKGKVEGDRDCGGIAGAMSVDEEDPEENSAGNAQYSFGGKYLSKCIIYDCTNEGNILSKKDGAGGIVGYMNLGLVTSSEAYGYIRSTEGDFVGGIAGETFGMIRQSSASVVLNGNQNIGGIAGYGALIHDCLSMTTIEHANSRFGAIAGQIKDMSASFEENVYDNYFFSKTVNGIDDISYAGVAQPVSYEELVNMPEAPNRFRQLQVIYLVDDEICETEMLSYGTKVDHLNYPTNKLEEELYVRWPELSQKELKENTVLAGESLSYITVLTSTEEQPLAMVEGSFREGTMLQAKEITGEVSSVAQNEDSYVLYEVSLTSDTTKLDSDYPLRILNPFTKAKLYCYEKDTWIEQDSEIRGDYLVTSLHNQTGTYLIVENNEPDTRLILIGFGIGLICIFGLFQLGKKMVAKRKKKSKKKSKKK